jgi:hypothetical protein
MNMNPSFKTAAVEIAEIKEKLRVARMRESKAICRTILLEHNRQKLTAAREALEAAYTNLKG